MRLSQGFDTNDVKISTCNLLTRTFVTSNDVNIVNSKETKTASKKSTYRFRQYGKDKFHLYDDS